MSLSINQTENNNISFDQNVYSEDLNEIKKLVKLLSKDRSTEYNQWYLVGECLHSIDDRLLIDWIEFSKKCPEKFDKKHCERLWKSMKPSKYMTKTLHYLASNDSPTEYSSMIHENIKKIMKTSYNISYQFVAKLIIETHKFQFKCASVKYNTWYEFRNHRWIQIDPDYSLGILICELMDEYSGHQPYSYDSTFKNGVIKECADMLFDPIFLENLDENSYLICFDNGVYNLRNDTFRDGYPDDNISLCTGYNYIELDKTSQTYNNIMSFLEKIQPDKDMREYLLTLLSTCLIGSAAEESLYVFAGSKSSGKSTLMELLKHTLGDLFKPMDMRLLTGKNTSSTSSTTSLMLPELADKKGIRVCCFDEPKSTDEMNENFIKFFTGGNIITARTLFRQPIYFKPQLKPFLLCNNFPNVELNDDGMWRRIKIIPFLSVFKPPSIFINKENLDKNELWADINLSKKLPQWRQTFMSILIKYYKRYYSKGLVHPDLVMEITFEHRQKRLKLSKL